MGRLNLSFKPNRPQRYALRAALGYRRRSIFLGYGRGVGKSWLLRQLWYCNIAKWEHKLRTEALEPFTGVRVVTLMPTLKQFKDVHMAGLESELLAGGKWAFLGAKIDRQSGQVRFPGGSTIKPFPASEYNSRTSRGLRGDILSADEVDDINGEVYDAVAVPWLSEPWSLGLEYLSGTPTRGRHGLWYRNLQAGKLGRKLRRGEITTAEALDTEPGQAMLDVFESLDADDWPAELPKEPEGAALFMLRNYYAFHATYRDAPETVSPMAVARAKANTNPATFKREWEADPDAGEGLIYPFDEKFHVRSPPPLETFNEFHVGADFGHNDPGALILFGVKGHGADAEVWALDEKYESECLNTVWDARAVAWKYATFWPDPSRADRINDWRNLGIDCRKVDNDIAGGIGRVADMMFRRPSEYGDDYARFYVAPKCRNLIKETGLYRWKKNLDGSFSDVPEDKDNHALDATRYFFVGRFGRGGNAGRVIVSGR